MTDDLPFSPPDTAPICSTATARRHRHQWEPTATTASQELLASEGQRFEVKSKCSVCGAWLGLASRRGRSNRRKGNDFERELARSLGGRRVGQYGLETDVRAGMFAVQAKVGTAFPERLWRWLNAIPRTDGAVPVLIVGDSPGPGHKRRALAIVDLTDWRDLHGEEPA